MIELKKEDSSVYDIRRFFSLVEYISECEYSDYNGNSDNVVEQLEDVDLGDYDVARVERLDFYDEDVELIRTETDLIQIRENDFYFTSYIKHTDPATILITSSISFDTII